MEFISNSDHTDSYSNLKRNATKNINLLYILLNYIIFIIFGLCLYCINPETYSNQEFNNN